MWIRFATCIIQLVFVIQAIQQMAICPKCLGRSIPPPKISCDPSVIQTQRSHRNQTILMTCMAGVTGLEPAASGVTGRRSNQLSYTPEMVGGKGLEPMTLSV